MEIKDILYRTNKTIIQACEELGIEFSEEILVELTEIEQCSHCNIWYNDWELIPDLDGNNICKFCSTWYGM